MKYVVGKVTTQTFVSPGNCTRDGFSTSIHTLTVIQTAAPQYELFTRYLPDV